MNLPIKFAVCGYGHIGKRHAQMINALPDAKLLGVFDPNPNTQDAFLEEFKVPFYNDLNELISSNSELEVLNVCSPNSYHASQSIQGLESGLHVVCEKPLGLNRAECEDVLFKSLQSKRLVFCVMQNRYSPPSQWLKEIVSSGKLGRIGLVSINCYWNRDDRYYKSGGWKGDLSIDGGTLFTQFSHFIDIMFWLFGDIKNIKSSFLDFNHQNLSEFEDSGVVQFEFMKGGLGNLNFSTSCWDQNLESSITIIGEKGSVKVGGQYMDQVIECHIKDYNMPDLPPSMPPNDYGSYKGSAANHHFVIQNVIDTLSGKNIATTNALEGLKVVEIIERIYQSAERPIKHKG